MADVHLNLDGGATAAQAEPVECSRRVFICLVGCLTIALGIILAWMFVYEKSLRPLSTAAKLFVALLTGAVSFCFARSFGKFALLLFEWYHGNPEGERLVDSLIQSDRPLIHML
ncbi:hypothetical protein CFC21_095096 [Triticum aestivum]|uniref:Uncharacterized protein n=4 Tax=Triticum TaxID=4564 RepID=A0A9R0YZX6_TRITD|nr:hypothetical protein TRIUR3_06987 [Triticum urartu]KAF7092635.1 hypothetical protein CFC21_095096 [Triticum aestivum]VAI68399.1 unnamed protein product [Triticum turgidum subsp. durum]